MAKLERRNFSSADDRRTVSKGKYETLTIGGRKVTKMTTDPGWRWSVDTKPTVGTKSCERHHYGYLLSGRMHTVMDNGTEIDFGPGDMVDIPPGHDGWTLGAEPAVFLDFGDPCNCG